MRKLFLVLITFVFALGAEDAIAQMNRRSIKRNNKRMMTYRGRKSWFGKEKVYSMVGVSINALNYYGDLSPKPNRFSTDISFTRPAIGLSFAHRFGPRYTLTASFMYGTLKGADIESADPGDLDNGIYRFKRGSKNDKDIFMVTSIKLTYILGKSFHRAKFR